MSEKTERVLRWLAIIPGAFLASVLALVAMHLILSNALMNETIQVSRESLVAIERFFSPIVLSIAFIYYGAKIAPTRQLEVALGLFVLGNLARFGLFFNAPLFDLQLERSLFATARIGSSAIAGLLAIFLIYQGGREEAKEPLPMTPVVDE